MEKSIITHRLDLVISLIDTTTGLSISERNVNFSSDGKAIPFVYKGGGTYILMDTQRKNVTYDITAEGFESSKVVVEYDESVSKAPEYFVMLIPKATRYTYSKLLTLEGTCSGITEIDAVITGSHDRLFQNYVPRGNVMNFFGGGELTEREYALVLEKEDRFISVDIRKKIEKFSVALKNPIEENVPVGSPVQRIVKGKVLSDGRYLLRVRDDGQNVTYLVRYVVDGNVKFKKIDFKNDEERILE